jgi:hypothetical protein
MINLLRSRKQPQQPRALGINHPFSIWIVGRSSCNDLN